MRSNLKTMTVTLADYADCAEPEEMSLCNENGDLVLPGKAEVCWRCSGTGSHDCWEGGMTGSEMDEQGPEFMEDYRAGHYSRPCTECNGERVVCVVDEDRATPAQLAIWNAWRDQEDAHYAETAAERRAGC